MTHGIITVLLPWLQHYWLEDSCRWHLKQFSWVALEAGGDHKEIVLLIKIAKDTWTYLSCGWDGSALKLLQAPEAAGRTSSQEPCKGSGMLHSVCISAI